MGDSAGARGIDAPGGDFHERDARRRKILLVVFYPAQRTDLVAIAEGRLGRARLAELCPIGPRRLAPLPSEPWLPQGVPAHHRHHLGEDQEVRIVVRIAAEGAFHQAYVGAALHRQDAVVFEYGLRRLFLGSDVVDAALHGEDLVVEVCAVCGQIQGHPSRRVRRREAGRLRVAEARPESSIPRHGYGPGIPCLDAVDARQTAPRGRVPHRQGGLQRGQSHAVERAGPDRCGFVGIVTAVVGQDGEVRQRGGSLGTRGRAATRGLWRLGNDGIAVPGKLAESP